MTKHEYRVTLRVPAVVTVDAHVEAASYGAAQEAAKQQMNAKGPMFLGSGRGLASDLDDYWCASMDGRNAEVFEVEKLSKHTKGAK